MRILLAPVEVAGQVGLTAHGLREIGQAAFAAFPPHPFAYEIPPDIPLPGERGLAAKLQRIAISQKLAGQFDVYHYHTERTLFHALFAWYGLLDVWQNRLLGKKVVVEFWGTDIRLPSVDIQRNPFYGGQPRIVEARNRKRLARWARVSRGHAIIADDSLRAYLAPYFSHIHVVRQRVDTRALQPVFPRVDVQRPLIVHAPSKKAVKGSRFVAQALARLAERGVVFDYLELTGATHAQVLAALARADLVIDQLTLGSHGVLAVEAMALGKPVICYMLPELLPTYPPGFPIIDANPRTLEAVVEEWLARPEDRARLGEQGREYTERVHDCREVAKRLLAVYEKLPSG